jgi:hypothetical protein
MISSPNRGVTAISYDRLTDILKRRVFWDTYRISEPYGSYAELREPHALNYAACPFFRALSQSGCRFRVGLTKRRQMSLCDAE